MVWNYAFAILAVVNAAMAMPSQDFKGLQSCAIQALSAGGNTAARVQTAANNTWEDARVGAVIKPEYPALIAFAQTTDEIAGLLKCASSTGYQPIPRSGRHHFEGWSTLNNSLVIDMSQFNYVKISSDRTNATIGGGANLGEIYTTLSTIGKTFLGGICPTVALGGYLGVGGYSVQERQYGMAIDQVLSFKAMLYNGQIVNASPTENSDLFFAARGGGTYAIVIDATVKILTLPRSAMLSADFDRASRFDVAKKWLAWSTNQTAAFTSQLNVYSNRTHLIGWYLGGSTTDLYNIVKASGLMSVPNANISITGNCSTENSRMFWQDPTTKCIDDKTAYQNFLHVYNTAPIWLTPIQPELRLNKTVALPQYPPAQYWQRFSVVSKTYFVLKSKPLSDANLMELINRSGALADDREFWGEWTSFGVPNPQTTGSFPWLADAATLMRMELPGGPAPSTYVANRAWLIDFDKFFRPVVGNASYAGYIDADISINPLLAYYGPNVCRLISIKKKYDPYNVFNNPQSIPTSPPPGLSCYGTRSVWA